MLVSRCWKQEIKCYILKIRRLCLVTWMSILFHFRRSWCTNKASLVKLINELIKTKIDGRWNIMKHVNKAESQLHWEAVSWPEREGCVVALTSRSPKQEGPWVREWQGLYSESVLNCFFKLKHGRLSFFGMQETIALCMKGSRYLKYKKYYENL